MSQHGETNFTMDQYASSKHKGRSVRSKPWTWYHKWQANQVDQTGSEQENSTPSGLKPLGRLQQQQTHGIYIGGPNLCCSARAYLEEHYPINTYASRPLAK